VGFDAPEKRGYAFEKALNRASGGGEVAMMMPADPASQFAMQGQQAMQSGMYHQAAQYFAQAIQYAPNNDALHYHYASACVWRGQPQEALMSLDRCMGLRGPWYNHAMQMSQQIRMQMGQQMMPMQQMPMQGQMPMQQMPMQGQMPMQQMPMQGQMPMQQMPMQGGQMQMQGGGMQMQQPPQQAAAPAEDDKKKKKKKKKKGIGWGAAALGIVGAAAIGGAIGTGALDGVADDIF
jgi:hypothetical protein